MYNIAQKTRKVKHFFTFFFGTKIAGRFRANFRNRIGRGSRSRYPRTPRSREGRPCLADRRFRCESQLGQQPKGRSP